MTTSNNFTLDEIKAANIRVKTVADFPTYIRELKQLGLHHYETYVADGHTEYFGNNGHCVTAPARYERIEVADKGNVETFKADLSTHQQGKAGYDVFCSNCAKSGVFKWVVDFNEMTCTYYDKNNELIVVEKIAQ